MREKQSEKGSALMGVLLLVVILSMLATVSLNLAAQEMEGLAAAKEDAAARHLAEAGADLVMQWLHDPSSAPPGLSGGLLARRQLSRHRRRSIQADGIFRGAHMKGAQRLGDPAGQRHVGLRSLRNEEARLPHAVCVGHDTALHHLNRDVSVKVNRRHLRIELEQNDLGKLGVVLPRCLNLPLSGEVACLGVDDSDLNSAVHGEIEEAISLRGR